MFGKIKKHLSKPKDLAIVNAVLIALMLLTNVVLQAFCRPSEWATVVLIICFSNTILYPLLTKETLVFYMSNFISGISLGIFVYCVIFLGHMNLLWLFAILIFGLGLIAYLPYFFVIQLLYKYLFSYKNKLTKVLFCGGILTCLSAAFCFGEQYKQALSAMDNFTKSNYTSLERSFMTEKILGMYFKYHTQICEYDGWRPPLHEPALVIGQWFNGRRDPLNPGEEYIINLKKRIQLYKKFFPEKKVKLNCSCAAAYSDDYHNDLLFATP